MEYRQFMAQKACHLVSSLLSIKIRKRYLIDNKELKILTLNVSYTLQHNNLLRSTKR